jgi:hypothetical protein
LWLKPCIIPEYVAAVVTFGAFVGAIVQNGYDLAVVTFGAFVQKG